MGVSPDQVVTGKDSDVGGGNGVLGGRSFGQAREVLQQRRNQPTPGVLVVDGLRWKGGACGCKLIADPTDEIGGAIRAGHRIAGLGHRFRPGKRTINLDGLGQADIQEGGAIGPGFFGFLAEDFADVFHLRPGGFAATKLGVDLSPGRQFNGSLVEDAAGPDNAEVWADDVGIGGVFIEIPGLAGVPSKLIATLGKMGRYHFCHLMPAHLLHPTGMSGSLKGTPLLIATEHWRKGEFMAVKMRLK
jgi:hypothetical protein